MSLITILREIERQAKADDDGGAFEIEVCLTSGRKIVGDLVSFTSFLKVNAWEGGERGKGAQRITYIPHERVEEITPIWL